MHPTADTNALIFGKGTGRRVMRGVRLLRWIESGKFMRRTPTLIAASLLALAAGLTAYRATSSEPSHVWRKMGGARVTCGGRACVECEVFRSLGGEIIVSVPETIRFFPDGVTRCDYVARPESSSVVATHNHLKRFGPLAWSVDAPVGGAEMAAAEGGGVEPQLVASPRSVEFTSLLRSKVRAEW